jgi:DNA mismatch repair protein MutS
LDDIASLLGLRVGVHKAPPGVPQDHRFQRFAGFPKIALRNHLDVLIANGKTVAIVDQLKPTATSDVITRKVVRIVTPGTLLDEGDLKSSDNNFLLSIYPKLKSRSIGLAWTDVSTGEFNIASTTFKQLQDELARIQPKEIIAPLELLVCNQDLESILTSTSALITRKPQLLFTNTASLEKLSKIIISNDPSKAIFASRPADVLKSLKPLQSDAACGLIGYLKETFPDIGGDLSLRTPSEVSSGGTMKIDSISLESLEIIKTQRQKTKKGSLISILDRTKTAAGHRLLSMRLRAPSTSLLEIRRRLDLVNLFYKDQHLCMTLVGLLSKCKDLERALQRIHFGTGAPSDLFNVVSTINTCTEIKLILEEKLDSNANTSVDLKDLQDIVRKLGEFDQLCSTLGNLLSEDRMTSNSLSTGVINTGVCNELDRERKLYQDLESQQEKRALELMELFSMIFALF